MKRTWELSIAGAGIWTRGITCFADLTSGTPIDSSAAWVPPAPAAIPPKERRRAGTLINLAVEVAHQACEHAGADKSAVPSVFASAMSDTRITDYMCRKLAGTEKLLSPTQFHNSVHNAASGYWTISAENRAPSTFVGGFDRSFGAGLLEASMQALSFNQPVLLVCCDIPTEQPLHEIIPITETCGLAVMVAPASTALPRTIARMSLTVAPGDVTPSRSTTVIPDGLLTATAQADGLSCLDALAAIAAGKTGSRTLLVQLPRTGHLIAELHSANQSRVATS